MRKLLAQILLLIFSLNWIIIRILRNPTQTQIWEKKLGFAFFNFSRRAARDTDRMEIQKYHVGARDACASTNRHEWSETRMKNLYLRNCVFATYFWKELSTSLTIWCDSHGQKKLKLIQDEFKNCMVLYVRTNTHQQKRYTQVYMCF